MLCGYGLVVAHIAKYFPQFFRNTERKSTVGLSPRMVALDLLGAAFALLQVVMDLLYLAKPASEEVVSPTSRLNMIKLFMATFSIAFDFVFLMQHFLMYKDAVQADLRKRIYERNHERR